MQGLCGENVLCWDARMLSAHSVAVLFCLFPLCGSYIPKDNSLQSETVHYKRGVCQQFCLPSHTVDPSEWTEEEVRQYGFKNKGRFFLPDTSAT